MLRFAAIIAALPLAAWSSPDEKSYDANPGVLAFSQQKCGEIIHAIDSDGPGPIKDNVTLDMYARDLGNFFAKQGVAWGFILGFDRASGGLHSSEQTTLQRLRVACANDPERTALSILEEFASK